MEGLEWLQSAQDAFDLRLHEDGAALVEMRGAGIPQARIESLFPFEIQSYYARTKELFRQQPGIDTDLLMIANECDMHEDVATRLPWPLRNQCQDLFSIDRSSGIDPDGTRRVVYGNLLMLPLLLRLLHQYPFEQYPGWGKGASSTGWNHNYLRQMLPKMEQAVAKILARIGAE